MGRYDYSNSEVHFTAQKMKKSLKENFFFCAAFSLNDCFTKLI